MKYLFVAKTGVLDALAVALGYLGKGDLNGSPFFGDMQLENSGHIIRVGTDTNNNEVFAVAFRYPLLTEKIDHQLKDLTNTHQEHQLKLIPLSVPGDSPGWYLLKLAKLPLVGSLFLNWAKGRTMSRKHELFQQGRKIRIEHDTRISSNAHKVIAAKPL